MNNLEGTVRAFLTSPTGRKISTVVGVAAIFVVVVYAGMAWISTAQEVDMNPMDLQGRWTLESIDGQIVEAPKDVFFEIPGAVISGFDGCNSLGGPLDTPARIRIGQRSCGDDYTPIPLDLTNPSLQLREAQLEDDRLTVTLPAAQGVAVFRRGPLD